MSISLTSPAAGTENPAARLNRDCLAAAPETAALLRQLAAGAAPERAQEAEPFWSALAQSHPHLFAQTGVFVSESDLKAMADLVQVMEEVVALPAFRQQALAQAPDIAAFEPGSAGVFLGYDFHLSDQGPRLIEINTNAGGALLCARLARNADPRAWGGCPEGKAARALVSDGAALEAKLVAMFQREWSLFKVAGGLNRPLGTIAIVDDAPETQFLAPEFQLFKNLFDTWGWRALVVDGAALTWDGDKLRAGAQVIDLVYNRLTDFFLEQPAHAALRQAYLARAVALTPNPRAYALYGDKRHLTWLSDPERLAELGVPEACRAVLLARIPRTVAVTPEAGERFWRERKQWFFKPATGFGSRAAYRGDKLTKRVFGEILAGNYVAQALVPPSERRVGAGEEGASLKLDVRNYAYNGQVQLVAARLYQGQTTNFRTPGGGFGPVFGVGERPKEA